MVYEKVVTVYDTVEHANKAVSILNAAGYNDSDISVVNKQTLAASNAHEVELREPGLWRRMFGTTVLDHEAKVYGRAVESGGVVVTVRVADSDVARVMGLLDTHNPVDVLQRAATVGAVPATLVAKAAAGAGTATVNTAPVTATAKAVAASATPSAPDVVRLAEEQLNVASDWFRKAVHASAVSSRRSRSRLPSLFMRNMHRCCAAPSLILATSPTSIGRIRPLR